MEGDLILERMKFNSLLILLIFLEGLFLAGIVAETEA